MKRKPKRGDFVLWEDELWIITKIKKSPAPHKLPLVYIKNYISGEVDQLLMLSLATTSLRVWEVE